MTEVGDSASGRNGQQGFERILQYNEVFGGAVGRWDSREANRDLAENGQPSE